MANKLPWMPWYGRDFRLDGKVQSLLIDDRMKWWYMTLLLHQWDEGAVPLDGNACRGIVSPDIGTPAKVWHAFTDLIPTFFPAIDEYLGQNTRLEEIRAEHVGAVDRRVEKARIAGLASGQARHKPNPSPTQDQPKLNSSSTQTPTQSELGRTKQKQKQMQNQTQIKKQDDASTDYLVRCVVALNRGMMANEQLAGEYREVPASTQAGVMDWEQDGIPIEVAESVVYDRASTYRPTDHNKQPHSLRYFDKAVREIWALEGQDNESLLLKKLRGVVT